MRGVRVGLLVLAFAGSAAVVRADDVPEPFKSLAGAWVRPRWKAVDLLPPVLAFRRTIDIIPPTRDLSLAERRKIEKMIFRPSDRWSLVVGAHPMLHSCMDCFATHRLTIDQDKPKGELVVVVGERKVRFQYELRKDVLTISCKESLPAGNYLKHHNISGEWVRNRPK